MTKYIVVVEEISLSSQVRKNKRDKVLVKKYIFFFLSSLLVDCDIAQYDDGYCTSCCGPHDSDRKKFISIVIFF